MSNLVIVALPAEDDPIYNISSEKVPHLTLLFLGDADSNPNVSAIAQTARIMASNFLQPFSLRIDHRGVLGDDQADVLFFSNEIPPELLRFRNRLLDDNNIRSAYNSVQQHTDWVPHTTLGYPDTPARSGDLPAYVSFDRIAIWSDNYSGAEVPLINRRVMDDEVGWKEQWARDFLEHHGIKGMKWGVRRSDPSGPNPVVVSTDRSKLAKGKAKVKTSGGEGHPPHPDAVKAATTKQKLKKSGKDSLSNEELQSLINRMNMEQNLSQLQTKNEAQGKKLAREILAPIAKQQVSNLAKKAATKQMEALLMKKR